MTALTLKQQLDGFKQIDYKLLPLNSLKKLLDCLNNKFMVWDYETNSYYWNTGLDEFNGLIEEFNLYCDDCFSNEKPLNPEVKE